MTSDAFILTIEQNDDAAFLHGVVETAFLFYVREVDMIKPRQRNVYVNETIKFINKNIRGTINVKETAAEIGISDGYLERLFLKSEDISIKQYFLRQKIHLAKNMLIYSDYTCCEIANYLGFCSQSHFALTFRKITKMTPGEYRSQFFKVSW